MKMVAYDLRHLTQGSTQEVSGPIQDDEALLLFALIRVMRIRRVLELGGLGGYSARNFCAAVGNKGIVYTVDLNPVVQIAENHRTIQKDVRYLTRGDVGNEAIGLIFFDCHDYVAQFDMFHRLQAEGMITDATFFALHDTNIHPTQTVPWAYPVRDGWVHQAVERRMANDFKRMGYDVLALGTSGASHDTDLPYRHGLTLVGRFRPFEI
jgi:hypothetical protein